MATDGGNRGNATAMVVVVVVLLLGGGGAAIYFLTRDEKDAQVIPGPPPGSQEMGYGGQPPAVYGGNSGRSMVGQVLDQAFGPGTGQAAEVVGGAIASEGGKYMVQGAKDLSAIAGGFRSVITEGSTGATDVIRLANAEGFSIAKGTIKTGAGLVKDAVGGLGGIYRSAIRGPTSVIQTGIGASTGLIKSGINTGVGAVKSAPRTVVNAGKTVVGGAVSAGKSAARGIKRGLGKIF